MEDRGDAPVFPRKKVLMEMLIGVSRLQSAGNKLFTQCFGSYIVGFALRPRCSYLSAKSIVYTVCPLEQVSELY